MVSELSTTILFFFSTGNIEYFYEYATINLYSIQEEFEDTKGVIAM